MNRNDDEFLHRARRLHQQAVVIDTHCDTTQRLLETHWDFTTRHASGHVDLPRLREGGVDAVFLAVWAPGPVDPPGSGVAAAQAQIDAIQDTVRRHEEHVAIARTATQVREAHQQGKVALIMAIEGGHLIEDSLDVLREYHRQGATYLTLTHMVHTNWADSSGLYEPLDPLHGGLTSFGREVIRTLNRLGMMVDVSHVSDATFWDVVETSTAPILATHSSCRSICPHGRNLTDEMMQAIASTDGVVQINFAAAFVDPDHPPIDRRQVERFLASGLKTDEPLTEHRTSLDILVDHFDHALQLIGPRHVGIGSDFDGVPTLPEGMEDCSKLPELTAALLRRGYDEADLTFVLGENVLRVLDACQQYAADMDTTQRPSEDCVAR